ncbi:MAG: menE [Bacillales bacterium]|jgi:O-succinylbenzoic acid--CoA ligase|nr:menE [Bacillales bacterium]
MANLSNFLRERVRLSPNNSALEFEDEKWSFRELEDVVICYGEKLSEFGVRAGETVALYGNNRPETVFLIHALLYIGAPILMLNTRLTKHEIMWQLNHAQVKKLISVKKQEFEDVQVIAVEDIVHVQGKKFTIKESVKSDEVATIMYTSGTTGYPKAVLQSFGNHYHSAISSCENLTLDEKDKWLCVMPLYHVSGLSILLRSVIVGLSVYLQEGFDEDDANTAIENRGITITSVVASSLSRMMKKPFYYPISFKGMLLGGGPASAELLEKCKDLGVAVFLSYGMTETCSQIVTLRPEDVLRKIGSAGKPIPGCKVKILIDGIECNPENSGEIVVKGPNVTTGYLHGEKSEAFQDGWFHTGDIGYLDKEGFLYVQDRRSDLFISGGENVYPAEIESVLMSFPQVMDVGVVGVPDEKWGSVPVAFVVLEKLVSIEDLSCFCQKRLAKYKVPKKFYLVKKLPRNASGKLLRKELRKRI